MELQEIIKSQNILLEFLIENPSVDRIKEYIKSNNELIDRLEFEAKHPVLASYRLTKLLVDNGFHYMSPRTGFHHQSYEKQHPSFRIFISDDNSMSFQWYKNDVWRTVSIPKEEFITQEYLNELLANK